MKPYKWNEDKNEKLKKERGIGFEDVEEAINSGALLDRIDNPNKKYPHQKIFVIEHENYVYRVPFVEDAEKIFFKTIIPSREATRKYLRNRV